MPLTNIFYSNKLLINILTYSFMNKLSINVYFLVASNNLIIYYTQNL